MMTTSKKISSRCSFIYKWIFPIVVLGILILFFCGMLYGVFYSISDKKIPAPVLLVPITMAVIAYLGMKKSLVFEIADKVYDEGDSLFIKNGGRETRILLSEIINIGYLPLSTMPVVLYLRKETLLGRKVSFIPSGPDGFGRKNQMLENLIVRVDEARRKLGN